MSKIRTYLLFLLGLLSFGLNAQGWEQTFGGTGVDVAHDLLASPDGGFYLLGNTASLSAGGQDLYLIKTGPDGVEEWSRNYGDSLWREYGRSIQYTSDGALIIAGFAKQEASISRAFLLKTDLQGNELWSRASPQDSTIGLSVTELPSGEFLLSGTREIKRINNGGSEYLDKDVYLLRTDANGNVLSSTSYGGIWWEEGHGVLNHSPSSVIVVGYTRSIGHGSYDVYLLEVDTQADTLIQERTYGTASEELGFALAPATDGGYLITGQEEKADNTHENTFLLKLDPSLDQQWWHSFALDGYETGRAVTETRTGAYLIAGESRPTLNGNRNSFVLRTDATGTLDWSRNFGGLLGEEALSVHALPQEAFVLAGYTNSYGAGSTDAYLVRSDSTGTAFSNIIYGNVFSDFTPNCSQDSTEAGIPGWIVSATGTITRYTLTDSLGNYEFQLDTGIYAIEVEVPSSYWDPCQASYAVQLNGSFDTIALDIPVQPEVDCPLLSVNISTPFLRRCFENVYSVEYCNNGTALATNATIAVDFDPFLQVDTSSIPVPYTHTGNQFTFDVGNLDLFDCGRFKVRTLLDCDSTVTGQTHCVEAHIFPDTICQPIDPGWDGSSIEVDGACEGDTAVFLITNVGQGDMDGPQRYVIIEDHLIMTSGDFNLLSHEDTTITFVPTGGTLRLEAEQSEGHPGLNDPSVTVEGCGEPFNTGHVIELPQNDGNPFIDIDCQESIGSYDPNDKRAFPKGLGEEHFIFPNTDIEYLIRFQNTGTDTAFRVVIRDTLSPWLDIRSVRQGVGSHPYTFEIYGENILKFTFDNILLPDSTTNEEASHGFVKFSVSQKPDNPNGTYLYNRAGIYFDYNEPVVTNWAWHLVGDHFLHQFITHVDSTAGAANIRYYPNPFTDYITFEWTHTEEVSAKPVRLHLMNLQGQILRQTSFRGKSFQLRRDNLAPGLYIFRIEQQGRVLGIGKIIIGR